MDIPNHSTNTVIIIAGPTASGKSALAYALAEKFAAQGEGIEIISVDSAQVYCDMDIGTAKPTAAEMSAFPHHLINLISPESSYSAGRFRVDALQAIAAIQARGHRALLVGGTMLYHQVLLQGIHDLPAAPAAIRADIEARAAREGWEALHQTLAKIDPESAVNIKPNDRQRISRALELIAVGQIPSEALKAQKATHSAAQSSAFPFPYRTIYLYPEDREALRRSIRNRWQQMWQQGIMEEFNQLREKYTLNANLPAMRAVGYRQLWDYVASQTSDTPWNLPHLHERACIATAQLAKRQITWLRAFIEKAQANATHPLILNSTAITPEAMLKMAWVFLEQSRFDELGRSSR